MNIILVLLLFFYSLEASLIEFHDATSRNRFMMKSYSMCKTTTNKSKKHYQKGYDCGGNHSIATFLNFNFLDPVFLGQQFYIFNDFMTYLAKQSRQQVAKALAAPDKFFAGAGVFMIQIGTSAYLYDIAGVSGVCPEGQIMLVALLKCNDGNRITIWSQDSICLSPEDTFKITVNSDADSFVTQAKKSDKKKDNKEWMRDPIVPSAVYSQADDGTPRKVKFTKIGLAAPKSEEDDDLDEKYTPVTAEQGADTSKVSAALNQDPSKAQVAPLVKKKKKAKKK